MTSGRRVLEISEKVFIWEQIEIRKRERSGYLCPCYFPLRLRWSGASLFGLDASVCRQERGAQWGEEEGEGEGTFTWGKIYIMNFPDLKIRYSLRRHWENSQLQKWVQGMPTGKGMKSTLSELPCFIWPSLWHYTLYLRVVLSRIQWRSNSSIYWPPHAKQCSKYFTFINLFDPHNNFMGKVLLLAPVLVLRLS